MQHVDEIPFDELDLTIVSDEEKNFQDYIIAGDMDVKVSAAMKEGTLHVSISKEFKHVMVHDPQHPLFKHLNMCEHADETLRLIKVR